MKVILNDYLEHVGERGDSVEVKPGFARNYLLPKGLAYPDTPGNRRRFEQEQHHWEEMDLGRRSAAEVLAKGMDGTQLKFERRAGERDVLFGCRRIMLDHPIKELGNFEVELNIHRDIKVTLPVFVVRPGEEPKLGGDAAEAAVVEEMAETEVAAAEAADVPEPAPEAVVE